MLDLFCIDDDWFVMDVVEFRVHPAATLDENRKQSVAATITRLGLNDLDWCETRHQHVEQYRQHGRLHFVEYLFPFVARRFAASACSSNRRVAVHELAKRARINMTPTGPRKQSQRDDLLRYAFVSGLLITVSASGPSACRLLKGGS